MNITRAAINRNRVTLVIILFAVLGGFLAYLKMPRAEDPGFPIRSAMVITQFPGASPERVEKLVSDKLEKRIRELPELDSVTSKNKTGVSLITVNVKSEYKELRPIWDKLRRKVDAAVADLPSGVLPPLVNDEFGDVYGTVIGLTGDGFSPRELEEIAKEVKDELLRLPDAAKVDMFGVHQERIFIEFKNERLAEMGISPAQLQHMLSAQNVVQAGGQIRSGPERYAFEPTGNFETVEQISATLIQVPGRAELVPLGDLAHISRGYADPIRSAFFNTAEPGIGLAISMREGGNIIRLGEGVDSLLEELSDRYPLGVEFETLLMQPRDVARLVDDFAMNLLQAIVIVMLSMIAFLGFRTGLVVAALIPSAIATSLLVMSAVDIGLDQMSLASLIIALGLLVDNAVVMAESTMVQMRAGKSALEAAVDSATELKIPLLTSSLTTCVAFLPIFLAESETGEYTAPLFKVVTITLLCSWLLSITLTPWLCVKFLKPAASNAEGDDAFNTPFYRRYRSVLLTLLRHRWLSLGALAGLFALAMVGLGRVPKIFFPPSDNPSFIVQLEMPTGTAIEETEYAVGRLEAFMRSELATNEERESGLEHWATYVGESGPRFYLSFTPEVSNPSLATVVATGTDREFIESAVVSVRRFIADQIPDARYTVEPRALGPSAKAPLMYELSGSNTDKLFEHVRALEQKLLDTPGTTNVRNDWGERTKKVVVHIDQAKARRAGVTSQDIALSLQTVLTGFKVTDYREGDLLIPVVLRSVAADRQDISKVADLSVYAQATGTSVPLNQVADLELVWEPSQTIRKNGVRTVTVLANVEPGVTVASVNRQTVNWLEQQKADVWPAGYRWELSGEAKNSAKANESINAQLPIAGFLIVLLLVWQFNSLRKPLIILVTVPLGVIGVVGGLLLFDSYFGFMTLLGIIALAGIVINNAIVLIDRIEIEIDQFGRSPREAIVESAQRRLRPILLTTFTTILGLIPLWLGGGPMWEPLAISIVVGLAFATLLTLGAVPLLYSALFGVDFRASDRPSPALDSSLEGAAQ